MIMIVSCVYVYLFLFCLSLPFLMSSYTLKCFLLDFFGLKENLYKNGNKSEDEVKQNINLYPQIDF